MAHLVPPAGPLSWTQRGPSHVSQEQGGRSLCPWVGHGDGPWKEKGRRGEMAWRKGGLLSWAIPPHRAGGVWPKQGEEEELALEIGSPEQARLR